jgi:hypothetical protein
LPTVVPAVGERTAPQLPLRRARPLDLSDRAVIRNSRAMASSRAGHRREQHRCRGSRRRPTHSGNPRAADCAREWADAREQEKRRRLRLETAERFARAAKALLWSALVIDTGRRYTP